MDKPQRLSPSDPTKRFSNRVENYIRYRPRYPQSIIELLKAAGALARESIIADVGSGTGFLAELFLGNGNRVFGIEPNQAMREAAERLLKSFSNFTSIAGTAESTTLADGSVDVVAAGQAFHWFDRPRCSAEFRRVLRPNGWVVLVWNDRRTDANEFLRQYEQLLRTYGTDYAQVDHKRMELNILREFFGTEPARRAVPNYQQLDFPGFKGRLLSSSYVPEAGQPGYEEMLASLKHVFDAHQQKGKVTLEYDTLVYYGHLA
jgi:SAM-dependent methyltransferase